MSDSTLRACVKSPDQQTLDRIHIGLLERLRERERLRQETQRLVREIDRQEVKK